MTTEKTIKLKTFPITVNSFVNQYFAQVIKTYERRFPEIIFSEGEKGLLIETICKVPVEVDASVLILMERFETIVNIIAEMRKENELLFVTCAG